MLVRNEATCDNRNYYEFSETECLVRTFQKSFEWTFLLCRWHCLWRKLFGNDTIVLYSTDKKIEEGVVNDIPATCSSPSFCQHHRATFGWTLSWKIDRKGKSYQMDSKFTQLDSFRFFLWGDVKNKVYKTPIRNLCDLTLLERNFLTKRLVS